MSGDLMMSDPQGTCCCLGIPCEEGEEAHAATAAQVVCGVVPLTRDCLLSPWAAPGLAYAEVLPSVAGFPCIGGSTVTPSPRCCCRVWPAHLAADGGLGWGGGGMGGLLPLHLGTRQEGGEGGQWYISRCLGLPTAARALRCSSGEH